MKIIRAELEAMAVKEEQYPEDMLPEIALAGRSNVGKSTLVNRLCNRKKLAFTSSSPGKTRTVNFYRIEAEADARRIHFRLVDLPGYGFAKAPKSEQEAWAKSINAYLSSREMLKDVILLCDLRHKPTEQDRTMFEWIQDAGFSGTVIATKADKVPRTHVAKQAKQICQPLEGLQTDHLFPYSGSDKSGIENIENYLLKLVQAEIPVEKQK